MVSISEEDVLILDLIEDLLSQFDIFSIQKLVHDTKGGEIIPVEGSVLNLSGDISDDLFFVHCSVVLTPMEQFGGE